MNNYKPHHEILKLAGQEMHLNEYDVENLAILNWIPNGTVAILDATDESTHALWNNLGKDFEVLGMQIFGNTVFGGVDFKHSNILLDTSGAVLGHFYYGGGETGVTEHLFPRKKWVGWKKYLSALIVLTNIKFIRAWVVTYPDGTFP